MNGSSYRPEFGLGVTSLGNRVLTDLSGLPQYAGKPGAQC